MKSIAAIAERFNIRSAELSMFIYPTIRSLASRIEALTTSQGDQVSGGVTQAYRNEFIEPPLVSRLASEPVPLTFAQEWEWRRWGTNRSRLRIGFIAVRLVGPLRVGALRDCIRELVLRHEPLRTTIDNSSCMPTQRVHQRLNGELAIVRLPLAAHSDLDASIRRHIEDLVTEPIDPAIGPLFASMLLKVTANQHVLVLALDHLICDNVSLRVLIQEIMSLYRQSKSVISPRLAPISLHIGDYAVWQRKTTPHWELRHGEYWRMYLANAAGVHLFPLKRVSSDTRSQVTWRDIRLSKELSSRLREICREERATLVTGVLAIYAALALTWCGSEDVVVPFITIGRSRPEVENAIGQFVYPLYLRISLNPTDNLRALVRSVAQQYRDAFVHRDSGRIASEYPSRSFSENPEFNWIPQGLDAGFKSFPIEIESPNEELQIQPLTIDPFFDRFESPTDWLREPAFLFLDTPDGVSGGITYLRAHAPLETVNNIDRMFCRIADRLISSPISR